MEPRLRAANRNNQALVILIDGVRRKVFPQLIREHEAVVLPGRARPETPLRLAAPLTVKQPHYEVGGRDPAPPIIFQGDQPILALPSFILGLLELLINQKRALVEVHPVPDEAQHLPFPQAGEQGDKIQQLKAVAVDLLQELPDGVIVQRLYLLLHNPGQCAGVRRSHTQVPNSNGLA